ncbi:hypothetical protein BBO99_00005647 [Phytophthora kernoviae]|uniref:Uncharacterized protein n=2 Tax=Phytophthora kernoviae TaxID=325452 RepID=A0A3R7JYK0_9STRA|nr:hypothetical protein G195_005559 [Phytophthora kernoviae 00238/432]KAG2519606.1 hypothetical protein JM16_006021 [Phytophthora kernoviae]KAG2520823.1 hypothetical protein JM18_006934 [Phytophthora kernoviae]RLN78875.1 hypothetical protein BBO99_00005647 [Phytophthora kernoviae]
MLRRDVTPERLFFLVVLVGTLLLISGLMLRHEGASSTRTFRDGFTVAEAEGTEDGDEITIKRSGTSKGKVTTISRHENGKLTIEDTAADERQEEVENEMESEEEQEQEQQGDHKAAETESPRVLLGQKEAPEDERGQVIVSNGKKVTVVQVNSLLTKVSLSDVEEAGRGATR